MLLLGVFFSNIRFILLKVENYADSFVSNRNIREKYLHNHFELSIFQCDSLFILILSVYQTHPADSAG